jgi:hypothetical protein
MIRQRSERRQAASTACDRHWGIIEGSIQLIQDATTMEAERINAISALLNDLTGREAELRRYL